ncbi:hypothetical protein [Streptomyces sp. NPDC005262]|uniref:hypothetical protein n=1 Tax=Streptomyces sp. NPDC005262 TaxID=3364710 RepID=UPI0036BE6E25
MHYRDGRTGSATAKVAGALPPTALYAATGLQYLPATPRRAGTPGAATGTDPGEWTGAWSASGVGHHGVLATGRLLPELRALADLGGLELVEVTGR